MANEKRLRTNLAAGALSASLSNSDTTMSSAGLADLGVVDSTNHAAVILFLADGAGRITSKEIVWVTAHTAAATTATISRGQEGTTGIAWASSATWVHAPTSSDIPIPVTYTVPTATAVTNTTLASYATPITVTVTVLVGQVVDVEAQLDATCSGDNVVYWGLRRNPSTVLAKSIFYTAGAGTRPQNASPRWTDTSPGSGSVTYELLGASSGGTLTAYPSDGSTSISYLTASSAGGTQIKATARWA